MDVGPAARKLDWMSGKVEEREERSDKDVLNLLSQVVWERIYSEKLEADRSTRERVWRWDPERGCPV